VLDYCKYLIFAVFAPFIVLWMDSEIMIEDGAFEFFIISIAVIGLTLITFAYLVSFMFKTVPAA